MRVWWDRDIFLRQLIIQRDKATQNLVNYIYFPLFIVNIICQGQTLGAPDQ